MCHGLYTSSTTSALSPTSLAYTAAGGKPSRRENTDVDPAAAPGYREMGGAGPHFGMWGTGTGPRSYKGSLESPGWDS